MEFTIKHATLVKDPEFIQSENGNTIAKLTVAKDHFKVDGEDDDGNKTFEKIGVSYFDLVAFGEVADWFEGFTKGEHIEVTDGKIRQKKWEDRDGNTRYNYEFIVWDFEEMVYE